MHRYSYDGPVTSFGNCVSNNWHGETVAPTESKARSNLAYQFKKKCNLTGGSKIELPGKIKLVE